MWKEKPADIMPSFKDWFAGKPVETVFGKGYLIEVRKHKGCPFVVKIGHAIFYL